MKFRFILIFSTVAVLFGGGNSFIYAQDYRLEPSEEKEEKKKDFELKTIGIKTNPATVLGGPIWLQGFIPLTGEFRITSEIITSPKGAVEIGASYLGPSPVINIERQLESIYHQNNLDVDVNIQGFRVQGRYKYYLLKDIKAPSGLFLAPNISYSRANLHQKEQGVPNPEEITFVIQKWNFQILGGYQLVADGGFTFDPFIGIGYQQYDFSVIDHNAPPGSSGSQQNAGDQLEEASSDGPSVRMGFNIGVFF